MVICCFWHQQETLYEHLLWYTRCRIPPLQLCCITKCSHSSLSAFECPIIAVLTFSTLEMVIIPSRADNAVWQITRHSYDHNMSDNYLGHSSCLTDFPTSFFSTWKITTFTFLEVKLQIESLLHMCRNASDAQCEVHCPEKVVTIYQGRQCCTEWYCAMTKLYVALSYFPFDCVIHVWSASQYVV